MENPKNLPFAMYDLAVYLPGGAVALVLLRAMVEGLLHQQLNLPVGGPGDNAVQQVITAVVWLAASYLTGHLVAFVSSYVVEKFVHNNLGYPSDNWIKGEQRISTTSHRDTVFRGIFSENIKNRRKTKVSAFINLIQLPAIIPLSILYWLKPFGFYSPKLPDGLLVPVSDEFSKLDCNVQLGAASRWEKVVEHYVSNQYLAAYTRLYNYLVIYGVLRTMSLLIIGYLWYFIFRDIELKIFHDVNIDVMRTIYFNILTFVYVLAVMAFAKFNRRYFEESILAFVFARKPRVS